MRIHIDIPSITCARCQIENTHYPTVLQAADDGDAEDSRGGKWRIVSSRLPEGWETPSGQKPICGECAATLQATIGAFYKAENTGTPIVLAQVTWADAEAHDRGRPLARQVSAVLPVAVAGNTQKAESLRGSNIPVVAPSPTQTASYHRAPASVVSSAVMAPPAAKSPTPAASVAPPPPSSPQSMSIRSQPTSQHPQRISVGPPPPSSPQSTVIKTGALPSHAQRVTVNAPSIAVEKSAMATIPLQAQRPTSQVSGAPPIEVDVKESPVVQPATQHPGGLVGVTGLPAIEKASSSTNELAKDLPAPSTEFGLAGNSAD